MVDGIGDPDSLRARSKECRRGLQTIESPAKTVGNRLAEAIVTPRCVIVPTAVTIGRRPSRGAVVVVTVDGDVDRAVACSPVPLRVDGREKTGEGQRDDDGIFHDREQVDEACPAR